jgi:hypothetical protein
MKFPIVWPDGQSLAPSSYWAVPRNAKVYSKSLPDPQVTILELEDTAVATYTSIGLERVGFQ